MSDKAENVDDNKSHKSSRHSSHKEIASKQQAKELDKSRGQDDADEPDKPTITEEDAKKNETEGKKEQTETKPTATKFEKDIVEDKSPTKPNIPRDKNKSKQKVKVPTVYKNKPDMERKGNKSKRTDKNTRSGAISKKKNSVAPVKQEKVQDNQVSIIYIKSIGKYGPRTS